MITILFISTSEMSGGAAIAARRLMEAINRGNSNVHVKMLVRDRSTDCPDVMDIGYNKWLKKAKFAWERGIIWLNHHFSKKNLFAVSIANTGFDVTRHPAFQQADIIHIHWTQQGMLSIRNMEQIFLSGKPVVWTMHDFWAATGICHYPFDCKKYLERCQDCPFIRPSIFDLSKHVFLKKKRVENLHSVRIVTVSSWLKHKVEQGSLLGRNHIDVIPNTIPIDRFSLLPYDDSRAKLSISKEKKVLIFGSAYIDNPVKDFRILTEALKILVDNNVIPLSSLLLIVFGKTKEPSRTLDLIPIDYKYIGEVSDFKTLSTLYSAADVVVSSSHYETFGQTLVEGMACGCVPVSFDGGGQADIINHQVNGYLVKKHTATELADGIVWALTNGRKLTRPFLRDDVIRRFSEQIVAQQYINLYHQLSGG